MQALVDGFELILEATIFGLLSNHGKELNALLKELNQEAFRLLQNPQIFADLEDWSAFFQSVNEYTTRIQQATSIWREFDENERESQEMTIFKRALIIRPKSPNRTAIHCCAMHASWRHSFDREMGIPLEDVSSAFRRRKSMIY